MTQRFKTIYFPEEAGEVSVSNRLTISLPEPSESFPRKFLDLVKSLSSTQLRNALGESSLSQLARRAEAENRSLSNYCIVRLLRVLHFRPKDRRSLVQTTLPIDEPGPNGGERLGITFRDSRFEPIHRWYPYVEGFSSTYVREVLTQLANENQTIYDPFGGCGTVLLEASLLGLRSYFSEINPFGSFVTRTKVNQVRVAQSDLKNVQETLGAFELRLLGLDRLAQKVSIESYKSAFPGRDYFAEQDVRKLLACLEIASDCARDSPSAHDLLRLAVASIAVASSNMTRRADLRRRRDDEYIGRIVDVRRSVVAKLSEIKDDLNRSRPLVDTKEVFADARHPPQTFANSIDLALTSPPYVNGTNYFRNTKIELWLLGFIQSEAELPKFTASAIASGINNVTIGRTPKRMFPEVERVAEELDKVAYDGRIPRLVRCYFSDMAEVLESVLLGLVPEGRFILDIGDSRFAGVHVETDSLLADMAAELGYQVERRRILARRHSLDKSPLRQSELVLRKPPDRSSGRLGLGSLSRGSGHCGLEESISLFGREIPFKQQPYAKRNWGHPLHSLCSYQGKLKPGVAHWLIRSFTEKGQRVLDPLGGVGTIAFEAALQGRLSITNDLSPLAYAVATAKVCCPRREDVHESLSRLATSVHDAKLTEEDLASAEFGLNGSISDYFHPKTLLEILRARNYFLGMSHLSPADAFVKASLLHVLHGNRPYALSRVSHPVTPFHPSGPAPYKSVADKVKDRVDLALLTQLPRTFVRGESYNTDFRKLPAMLRQKMDCIITSPPFIGLRFDRPNWMRLWFCGWKAEDFQNTSQSFLERQQLESMEVYHSFFDACAELLNPGGPLVLHIGGSTKYDMSTKLAELGGQYFRLVRTVVENVEHVEKHGIKDKGATTEHRFMFFFRL